MTQYRKVNASKRAGVLLIIMALSATTLVAQDASAQVPVYKIEGVVYGPDYKPLQGATVTAQTAAGTAGTATTDAAGKFSIGSLQSGTYNVTAKHACCESDAIPVGVSGTDPTVQQNFRLRAPGGSQSGPAHTLQGVVKDEKSGKPVAGALLEVWNYYQEESGDGDERYYMRPPGGQQYFSATSGPDGTYTFSLRPGHVNLNARADGFDHLYANFEIRENRVVDLPMKAAAGESALVKGTVKDAEGKPIEGAYVNIQPDYRCKDDVCMSTSYPTESRQDGDVYFHYEPRYGQYNGTTTGRDGTFELRIAPGDLLVSADAYNFVREEQGVRAEGGEEKTVDLVMEEIPPDSVKLRGTVRDANTGKPIPHAQINVENQQWGHWNSTVTDEDGRYELWTKPGYTLITASAYRYYYIPCDYEASPEPRSSDSSNSSSPGKPTPACDGSGERDQEFFPRVATLSGNASASEPLDFDLEPRPAPTATFTGYIVNQSSQKGIEGVSVQFYNERTHDYGSATTDEHGSYKITVHGGYYTVRAYAPGFFDAVVNAEVGDRDEARLDVFMTPGERKYGGGCCYAMEDVAYGGGGGYKTSAQPMPARAQASGPASMGASSEMAADSDAQGGQQSYLGSGGGLGPYKPASDSRTGGTVAAPGVLLAMLVGLAAVVVRRVRQG